MSIKRRDYKNRILQNGESQRKDFCSSMAKAGMNPKILQKITGLKFYNF